MGYTSDGFATLLLTMALSPNREEYARPYSTQEYYKLEQRVQESSYRSIGELIGVDISGLMMNLNISEEEGYRIFTLLNRGVQLGYANLTVHDGELTVAAALTVDGTIDKASVYVARDAVSASTLGTNRFTGTKAKLNRAVSLGRTPYAAVMLQLTVSYDEATSQYHWEDPLYLEEQHRLWEMMHLTTASEAVG